MNVRRLTDATPSVFDHEITGLIGRGAESKRLKGQLQNPRYPLIALVGPGGSGKTALCLDTLRECCNDPLSSKWMDECVYVSAKTEQLTAAGITPTKNAATSIEAVKIEIASALSGGDSEPQNFDSVAESLSARRVLLCLDNLETLVRDDPELFGKFYAALPPSWRLIVTSRVSVDSATAVPVDAMTESSAEALVAAYVNKRSGSRLDRGTAKKIAAATSCNPLAIRLVIDSYLAGGPLEEALKQTKDNVLRFSYQNLLHSLPASAPEILECLFAAGKVYALTRSELTTLLEREIDEIAEGISALVQTSLVTRHPAEVEECSISSSVRELLLRDPLDASVRSAVRDKLQRTQETITSLEQAASTDPLDPDFIPQDAPDHLRVVAYGAFKAARNEASPDRLLQYRQQIGQLVVEEPAHAFLYRALAALYVALSDRHSALEALRLGCSASPADASTALLLGEHLFEDKLHREASEATLGLLDEGLSGGSLAKRQNRARLLKTHWLSTIWSGQQMKAVRALESWDGYGDLSGIAGLTSYEFLYHRL